MDLIVDTPYFAPSTKYFTTKDAFNEAVGKHFIAHANAILSKGLPFIVGLSHGQSPAGAYNYIVEHYTELKNAENICFTFVNSPLVSQEGLEGIIDARIFIKKMIKNGLIDSDQIIGRNYIEEETDEYCIEFNQELNAYLSANNKQGLDYVFLACNPDGRIAGIERNSKSFQSKEAALVVVVKKQKEITLTPDFIKKSNTIAFLATKSDKRRPLAWLYSNWGKPDESPSFIRFIDNVQNRVTVFVDDLALTWPQIEIERVTPYGISTIKIDLPQPYKPNAKEKLPVVLLIHGFLGLNSFDALLAAMPTTKYIAAAMHYGSIPSDLPVNDYSNHIVKNIDAVVDFFGSKGHPVYIFDHSMGNIYFQIMDRDYEKLNGIKKYLKGRIGANPFFGEEAKHALIGFLDNVILPSMSFLENTTEKSVLFALRRLVPFDTKRGVRRRGINLSMMLINNDSKKRNNIWIATKQRILYLMTNLDSLPQLNRIPIENALNRLPAKIFAIQIHSALLESKSFDNNRGLTNMKKYNIPVLILKSEKDGVAKFVPRIYESDNVAIRDITNPDDNDLFREHLFHMVKPLETTKIIDDFISKTSLNLKITH